MYGTATFSAFMQRQRSLLVKRLSLDDNGMMMDGDDDDDDEQDDDDDNNNNNNNNRNMVVVVVVGGGGGDNYVTDISSRNTNYQLLFTYKAQIHNPDNKTNTHL